MGRIDPLYRTPAKEGVSSILAFGRFPAGSCLVDGRSGLDGVESSAPAERVPFSLHSSGTVPCSLSGWNHSRHLGVERAFEDMTSYHPALVSCS